MGLVEEEIKGVLIDIRNYDVGRRRAYKLVRQNMRRVHSDRLIGESHLSHSDDSFDDEDRYSYLDLTTAPVEIRRRTEAASASSSNSIVPIISGPGANSACCIAEELQTFLHTGQKLDEPRYVCMYVCMLYFCINSCQSDKFFMETISSSLSLRLLDNSTSYEL